MRILVIEDEHKIANAIKKGLEQELFAVDVAYDGITGFDFAFSESYDAIILDRLLPQMDGVTICKKLREKNIHTPILMLTAKGKVEDRVEGLNSGADDYLVKPFAFEEFLARINALLRRPHSSVSSVFQIDNIVLHTDSHIVKKGKTEINLSAKEFSLLEYLLRQKGKIVTKEELINHVWNYDSNILPNTVEAFIKLLRKKIDDPVEKSIIKTVRGIGYIIEKK